MTSEKKSGASHTPRLWASLLTGLLLIAAALVAGAKTGQRGGKFVDGIHFAYKGGQIKSLLSLISYLGSGKYKERFVGVKIPRTNIEDHHLEDARKFAGKLADGLSVGEPAPQV